MNRYTLRSLLLAGTAATALFGAAAAAQAAAVPEFIITETSTGPNSGEFDVVNNSNLNGDNWYIWGFFVGNPNPLSASQVFDPVHWAANACTGSCTGSTGTNGFDYFNASDGNAFSLTALSHDIAPGTDTGNAFFFNTLTLGSPFGLDVVNSSGGTSTIPGTTTAGAGPIPEPGSILLLGTGLLGLAGIGQRRKRCSSA